MSGEERAWVAGEHWGSVFGNGEIKHVGVSAEDWTYGVDEKGVEIAVRLRAGRREVVKYVEGVGEGQECMAVAVHGVGVVRYKKVPDGNRLTLDEWHIERVGGVSLAEGNTLTEVDAFRDDIILRVSSTNGPLVSRYKFSSGNFGSVRMIEMLREGRDPRDLYDLVHHEYEGASIAIDI